MLAIDEELRTFQCVPLLSNQHAPYEKIQIPTHGVKYRTKFCPESPFLREDKMLCEPCNTRYNAVGRHKGCRAVNTTGVQENLLF